VFEAAVRHGQSFAKAHGLSIETAAAAIDKSIDELQRKVTKPGEEPSRARIRIDDRPEATIWKEAMDLNLLAAHEAALSVRMSMTTGDKPVVSGDVQKLVRHLNEVSDLLGGATDKKASQPYKQRVRRVLGEVRALQHEDTKGALTNLFNKSRLAEVARVLELKVEY
jgi:hypothetical protein